MQPAAACCAPLWSWLAARGWPHQVAGLPWLQAGGLEGLKLYGMVGLPGEEEEGG